VATDHGTIVLGWLTKLTVGLALAGALFFDTFSLMATQLGAQDQAVTAASEAARAWRDTGDIQATYDRASSTIEPGTTAEIDVTTFRIDPDGTAVVTITRTAPTFLLKHVPPLRKFIEATATADAKPVQY
jgi:hypothetical protein